MFQYSTYVWGLPFPNTGLDQNCSCKVLTETLSSFSLKDCFCVSGFEQWGAGVVTCLGRGADVHMAQLPFTISCSSKSRLVLRFWYQLTRVVPDKGPLNGCCSCPQNLINFTMSIVPPYTTFFTQKYEKYYTYLTLAIPASIKICWLNAFCDTNTKFSG